MSSPYQGHRMADPIIGNIESIKFKDTWPNGRAFKHGAMEINFLFGSTSRISAEDDVEALMESQGYVRGTDYHIPGWNYPLYYNRDLVIDRVIITFDNDETFVMAKLSWDLNDHD